MMSECCLRGFKWDGELQGKEVEVSGQICYVIGFNLDVGIIVIYDLYGWIFDNIRLFVDSYVVEVGVIVYVFDL